MGFNSFLDALPCPRCFIPFSGLRNFRKGLFASTHFIGVGGNNFSTFLWKHCWQLCFALSQTFQYSSTQCPEIRHLLSYNAPPVCSVSSQYQRAQSAVNCGFPPLTAFSARLT